VKVAAQAWKRHMGAEAFPYAVKRLGKKLHKHRHTEIYRIGSAENWALCATILELHAIADTACEGFGIPMASFESADDVITHYVASDKLARTGTLSDLLCDRVRVLPKLSTAQVGITLRSMSHYLSIDRTEVGISWHTHESMCRSLERRLNLLVIPWPYEVHAKAFKPRKSSSNGTSGEFGMFSFEPDAKFSRVRTAEILKAAKDKAGEVHGVILPESALSTKEIRSFQTKLTRAGVSFLVAGIRDERANYAHLGFQFAGSWRESRQHKHHRWRIDESQIYQYHLGSALHPGQKWWESIDVRDRHLNFVTANEWLTICHLICEDLARQDPAAQVIRAVGPTLVVALLLDGPQLSSRWPGRYASVLADDPGSSVLSVTSLGMAIRSRPPGTRVSRAVALWKDSVRGSQELQLDEGADALLLSLCADWSKQWSADGRSDDNTASSHLVLSGVEQIRA
jgi:hypothetical protein